MDTKYCRIKINKHFRGERVNIVRCISKQLISFGSGSTSWFRACLKVQQQELEGYVRRNRICTLIENEYSTRLAAEN